MIFIELLLILFIVVVIIDDSGITDSIKLAISKLLTKGKITTTDFRIKPFDCSYCMNFWIGVLYALYMSLLTIPVLAYILLLSTLTPITLTLLNLFKDIIIKLIDKFYE